MPLGQDMPSIAPEDYVTTPGTASAGPSSIVDRDNPSSIFTVAYYADQIKRFQDVLNQLDATALVVSNAIPTLDPTIDADAVAAYSQWLQDYVDKKGEIQLAAKAVNGVVSVANSFGLGLPTLALPQTLQVVPALAIAGAVAAVAAAAAIIAWAVEQIAKAHDIAGLIRSLPADQQEQLTSQLIAASGSPGVFGNLATIVKWAVIAGLAWFGLQAFTEYRRGAA